jgi:site-specific recombinase XerD
MIYLVDVSTHLEAFQLSLLADDASQNTTSAYLSDLKHFVTWYVQTQEVEAFHLDEITPTDVRDYREHLQEQVPPSAPSTINRRLAALRRFFAWAKEHQLIAAEPTTRIHNVESTEHRAQSLNRKQWNRLQRSLERARGTQGVRDRCIVLLLYHTRLRAGELARVRLDDLTLSERSGLVNVRRGKGNKARQVPLNAEARFGSDSI